MRHDLAKLNTLELHLFIILCYLVKFYCCILSRLRFLPPLNRRKSYSFHTPERRRLAMLRYRWGRYFDMTDESPWDTQTRA